MCKLIKLIIVIEVAISLPLDGIASVLPTCNLMSTNNNYTAMVMQMKQMQDHQVVVEVSTNKTPSRNCSCKCKHMASQACSQSANCTSCVNVIAVLFYRMPVAALSTSIYANGPQMHSPPFITSSHFRPPIIASA